MYNISLCFTVGLHNPTTAHEYSARTTDCWESLLFTYKAFIYDPAMCSAQVCPPHTRPSFMESKSRVTPKRQEVKTNAKEKTNQLDSPSIPGCPQAHSSLLLEPWFSSLLMKTWTVAASPSQVPAGSVEACFVDYPPAVNKRLPVAPVVRVVLSSMGVTPPLAGLGYGRRREGGVQTPLSHLNKSLSHGNGVTTEEQEQWLGSPPFWKAFGWGDTRLVDFVGMVGHMVSEPYGSGGKQDAASPRWASVPFSVKRGALWFSPCRAEGKIN